MKMDKIASSKNDEFYTPKYAVDPIVTHLYNKNFKNIWCPFDTLDSNFVKVLSNSGFNIIYSHLSLGYDFFTTKTPDCDCIVSNPPYSLKGPVLQALFEINKPFAMLVGIVGLFESEKRFAMFEKYNFEILYMNRRVDYFKNFQDQIPSINPPFSSVYVCRNVLPKQICFARINKKDLILNINRMSE